PFASLRVTRGPRPHGSLLFVYDLVVRLDHVVLRLPRGGGLARRRAGGLSPAAALGLALGALVERGARGRIGGVEVVERAADGIRLAGSERLARGLERRIQPGLGLRWPPVP